MNTVIIIDCDQGSCWSALQSLQLNQYQLVRSDNCQQVLESVKAETVALVLCNLDVPGFDRAELMQLQTACMIEPGTPILALSEEQSTLQDIMARDCSHVELCSTSAGFDYIQYRMNYHLLQRDFAQQQALTLSNLLKRTQVLLESASEGIIQYDESGLIQSANPKALQFLKYSELQLLDTSVFELLGTAEDEKIDAEKVKRELAKRMLRRKPYVCKRVLLNTHGGSPIMAEISCNCIANKEGEIVSHIMMFQDITARTINEQRLIKLAKYDVLTGLSNRSKFHDFTEGKIAYCAHNHKKMALLFIDLDHFKNINDSMGHDAGDELLVAVAERLQGCVRESDLVARIGGDEFAITLLEMGGPNQVTRIVRHILEVLSEPFYVQSRQVSISASIGISLFPENGADLGTLTKTADTAMHQAKIDGRNTYRFFSEEIQNRVMEQTSLEDALRRGIANDEFFMHYQPQMDSASGRLVGLEALVRWEHKDWPDVGPQRFIPVAEECGLLPALGKWVLYSACRQAMKWRNDKDIQFDFPIAVNLSPKQLVSGDFIDLLEQVLRDTALPPQNLVLELTETAVMNNPDVAITTLGKINAFGVKLSVDDFGTGYSSLNYLKKLPINKLKIDRSFIKDIGVDPNGEAIVKAILALAHTLNLQVVAEGVEELVHVEFLREHKCDQLQGFFFSKPLSVEATTEVLRQEKIKWDSKNSDAGKAKSAYGLQFKPPFHSPGCH